MLISWRSLLALGAIAAAASPAAASAPGADVTLVIPAAVYEQLQGGPLQSAGNVSLTNTQIESFLAQYAGPVQIGAVRLSDVPARVVAEFREVLIGAHALKDQRVLIDQRHMTVAVCPGAS